MPTQPPLPPLLAPYVSSLPQSSLTVLSSVLGATGNWLVLRFLYAALSVPSNSETAFGVNGSDGVKNRKVVLVSFLRGWEFWRSEAKRLGLDLARLTDKRQFAFVDGLSELFYNPTTATTAPQPTFPGIAAPRTVLPVRSQPSPVSARTPHPVPRPGNGSTNPASREIGPVKRLHLSGNGTAALDNLERDIVTVIKQLKAPTPGEVEEPEVLLIVDQPDLLLAATGPSRGIGATEMGDWVMGLQQNAHATILTLSSDSPLIHNASASAPQPATPLETEHAAFAIGSAHRAQMVMQLRNLETGAARDVSGVLRVSKGGAWGQNEVGAEGNWEEREVLYFMQRDGGVSVFGRGE
ncbi:hypothetical protein BDV32DRAFT_70218 [Aspergillus pseudonomiae]|uniref:Uncharacterized protein n=1 Tax=Aspergillus pseudonomiae TaxID=1506151 RepID=A0A5N7DN11_9EURO|nr:uncharacterized protein BDV37DRAFT_223277 [Aspergillus pseudonomiae]KAB8258295.1 hypothetical protein BDV32DRAFT_70218 [Aspergillus pseudonomiae]KAE8407832.1 hypothetical protein BDV37DRAFT_223277 [Aspergillus pseudonomiae]